MKEILIFSGTTEGRLLSETLENAQIPHTTCVATEYGEMVLQKSPIVKVHKGRMNTEEMKAFICEGGFSVVVDATHPYAELVSRNLKDAINGMSIVYLRLLRNHVSVQRDGIYYFDSNEDCEKALRETSGNILLTTGSKELAKYCVCDEVRDRLFVRVLQCKALFLWKQMKHY